MCKNSKNKVSIYVLGELLGEEVMSQVSEADDITQQLLDTHIHVHKHTVGNLQTHTL